MKHGKKYRAAAEKFDRNKVYSLEEAVKFLKENKIAKFDESVEVHVRTNVDPKKGDQQVRGTVDLPHGTGKSKKIAVITTTHAKDAKEAGADIVAGEELIEEIKSGKIFSAKNGFDILVATPEMMPKLAPVAKILGPKGLMPNPKTETVTTKIKETVEALKKGKAAFKNDNSANIHQAVGKLSFDDAKLIENVKAFMSGVEKAKPAGLKGKMIGNISLTSTMGVGLRITL
ncbi:MAG: 50S ribosomal protein L1 [Candidatus Pacebacteria bacterium]|nr:50S ribosomal protein L1 [Candidatus Paceibacterota bacterium]MDR3583383.1 50S ribosomal protein L1 [Candidatus Paceibacterota bacterium]